MKEVTIRGKLVEMGRLEYGNGIILDMNGIGQTVEIYGLSDEELKACANGFCEEVIVKIFVPSE